VSVGNGEEGYEAASVRVGNEEEDNGRPCEGGKWRRDNKTPLYGWEVEMRITMRPV
jgi:hypothetical protein